MNISFLTKGMTQLLFRVAAVVTILYFWLQLFPPSGFFLFQYPFREYNEYHWWAPRWLADSTFWQATNYGIASPLLVVSIFLALLGILGLRQHLSSKKSFQSARSLLSLILAAFGLMLVTSFVFSYFTFPEFNNGHTISIPTQLHIPLMVLFTATTIISVVAFGAWAFNLVTSRKMAVWAGVAMVVGILLISLNWFTVLFFPSQLMGHLSGLVMLLGIGWGIGLWHVGNLVDGQTVENQLPTISWKKLGLGAGALVLLWAVFVGGLYAWDARHAGALCPGSQTYTELEDGRTKVFQEHQDYSFTYINSNDMEWFGQKYNAQNDQGGCGLSTWKIPEWVNNAATWYLPISDYWLYETYAPEPDQPVASFFVRVDDSEFATLEEYRADLSQRQEAGRKMANEEGRALPDIEESSSSLGGLEALHSVATNDNMPNQQNYYHWEYHKTIKDGKLYDVGWQVGAKSPEERADFIAKHRQDLDAMVDSFTFK